ncbi:hypothetical protein IJH66_01090 [Candidatus Saccharibacteria bacterium]|nr:hypothetical protein [Candidatus Saccharibacteria bacterium]
MTEAKKSKTEQAAEKREYLERKKKLLAEEAENFQKIIFLRATKGYWMVGGHSAVILVNKLAKELKIRVTLKRDTDFDVKFPEGVVNLRNLDFYIQKLKESNYLEKEVERNESSVIFKLKEKVSETEYDLLLRSKEIRRQKLQSMIEKSVPMPKLNIRMTDVLKLTFRFYKKHSDSFARKFVVEQFAEDIRVAHKTMLLVFRGQVEPVEGIRKMKTRLELALCDLTQIISLEIWTIEDSTNMATSIIETELIADSELKRLVKQGKRESNGVKLVKKLIENNN